MNLASESRANYVFSMVPFVGLPEILVALQPETTKQRTGAEDKDQGACFSGVSRRGDTHGISAKFWHGGNSDRSRNRQMSHR